MAYWELLEMSWNVLAWVVTYVWMFCLVIFVMIMIKTMVDLSKRIASHAKPGWSKFLKKSGLR